MMLTKINQYIGNNRVFYEKNTHIVDSYINITFDELQDLDDDEFDQWVKNVRSEVLRIWDTHDIPPRSGGRNVDEIKVQMNRMISTPAGKIEGIDELANDGRPNAILNRTGLGVVADQFFPTMYKTRINQTKHDDGYSIYDLFNGDRFEKSMLHRSRRHHRRDGMYHYAFTLLKDDDTYSPVRSDSAVEWVKACHDNPKIFRGIDFFVEKCDPPGYINDGYYQVNTGDTLTLTYDEVKDLYSQKFLIDRNIRNININEHEDGKVYRVRIYKKGQRVFPRGLIPFRIGYTQPAVNFPPFTAKYLYERFTEHLIDQDRIVIYDPSAGWGGRILGAMSVKDDRKIHYVGTDPNPDNHFPEHNTSRYECLAGFFNSCTIRSNTVFSHCNTYDVYNACSEEIDKEEGFQQYKGQVDLVFTSPPYFNREAYSEDPRQSYKRYGSSYESWKRGYLRPTLEICYNWMKSGAYILWNIADLQMGKDFLPLEKDSCDIMEDLGFEKIIMLKMALEGMPGSNRVDKNGIPLHTRTCKIGSRHWKYEPIFVYRKP